MEITLDPSLADGYTSTAQRSRVITEGWAEENLYCLSCKADQIEAHRPGRKVEDFYCPSCDRRTQLKSKRGSFGRKVSSSAYEAKMEAIQSDDTPDYAFMSFDPDAWRVTNLFVVPGHFVTPSVIERRNPLSPDAQRSGWVGSNILLDRIPDAGRIDIVESSESISPEEARQRFDETLFVSEKSVNTRDWTTSVMNCIDDLSVQPGEEFMLTDVYQFEERLAEMYPENDHIRAKIRQQLQLLRDQKLIEFLGDGEYRLRWVDTRDRG